MLCCGRSIYRGGLLAMGDGAVAKGLHGFVCSSSSSGFNAGRYGLGRVCVVVVVVFAEVAVVVLEAIIVVAAAVVVPVVTPSDHQRLVPAKGCKK